MVALYHPAASSSSAAPQPSSSAIAPVPLPSTAVPLPSSGGSGVSGSLSSVEQGLVIINTTLQYSSEQAAGTGMVINSDGLVLTNNHVIENATKITATVASTGKNFVAKVVGYDVTGDIALLQLQNPSGLHAVPIGDASKLKTGATVVALGNAEGRSEIVPATGQVTGLNQSITASDQGGTVKSETLHGMIETNANIVAGDSGGPLVNSAGKVIGMDTAGNNVSFTAAADGIRLRHPDQHRPVGRPTRSSQATPAPPSWSATRPSSGSTSARAPTATRRTRPRSSSSRTTASAASATASGTVTVTGTAAAQGCYNSDANLSVPSTIASVNSGTLVIGTICGSPAATAGLTAGSVITGVNGQAVGSPQSLATHHGHAPPGRYGLRHLGHPVRPAQDRQPGPHRRPAPVTVTPR